jgi:hypothetical protein
VHWPQICEQARRRTWPRSGDSLIPERLGDFAKISLVAFISVRIAEVGRIQRIE